MYDSFMSTRNKIDWLLIIYFIMTFCIMNANAQEAGEWVAAEANRSLPGQENVPGKTYFSTKFGTKEGTFAATYRSAFEKRNKIAGKFIVGRFRYVYDEPMGENDSDIFPVHNEYITTIMLDCKNAFVGTIKSEYLLNGKKVLENITPDEDLEMVQINMSNTTVGDLCAFAREKGEW